MPEHEHEFKVGDIVEFVEDANLDMWFGKAKKPGRYLMVKAIGVDAWGDTEYKSARLMDISNRKMLNLRKVNPDYRPTNGRDGIFWSFNHLKPVGGFVSKVIKITKKS